MPKERLRNPQLQEILEQRGVELSLEESDNGLPRLRAVFPQKRRVESKITCDGCKEPGKIKHTSKTHPLKTFGVNVQFHNIQIVNVPSCRLSDACTRDEITNMSQNCQNGKAGDDEQYRIIEDTVKYIRDTLIENNIRRDCVSKESVRGAIMLISDHNIQGV